MSVKVLKQERSRREDPLTDDEFHEQVTTVLMCGTGV